MNNFDQSILMRILVYDLGVFIGTKKPNLIVEPNQIEQRIAKPFGSDR